ncbi:MAG TPA: xanthine dehydrogenase molybdopterin binding subunit, partial [Anaeromyxobacteraceae bacterium]|nr:xanthine dehydrogenase molybdopterin binding subunit [Anaeromyxobacteraceae bacterium]
MRRAPKVAAPKGTVHAPLPHDSALRHVTGEAVYVDDLPEPRDLLHAYLRLSERAHARIVKLDAAPCRSAPGVAAVVTAQDLPAANDVGPVFPGDLLFADGKVEYF